MNMRLTASAIRRQSTRMHWDMMKDERANNLVNVLDGYFDQGAHHLNVNVFGIEKLKDAMEHPKEGNMRTSRSAFLDMPLNLLT